MKKLFISFQSHSHSPHCYRRVYGHLNRLISRKRKRFTNLFHFQFPFSFVCVSLASRMMMIGLCISWLSSTNNKNFPFAIVCLWRRLTQSRHKLWVFIRKKKRAIVWESFFRFPFHEVYQRRCGTGEISETSALLNFFLFLLFWVWIFQ